MDTKQLGHPVLGRLSDFADGDMGSIWRRRVTEHLAVCPGCRRRVSFIREIDAIASRLPAPGPPRTLKHRILDEHRRAAGGDRRRPSDAAERILEGRVTF